MDVSHHEVWNYPWPANIVLIREGRFFPAAWIFSFNVSQVRAVCWSAGEHLRSVQCCDHL